MVSAATVSHTTGVQKRRANVWGAMMAVVNYSDQASSILSRADFSDLAVGVDLRLDDELDSPFVVTRAGGILLHPACASDPSSHAIAVRHALELLLLRRIWPALPALAGLAAARTAALFAEIEAPGLQGRPPGDFTAEQHKLLTSDLPLDAAQARALWLALARYQPGPHGDVPLTTTGLLARIWTVLGPVDRLMRTPGYARLSLDPATGLNGYGSSLRPRPSAAAFASDTASSPSERGFAAAEAMRRTVLSEIVTDARAAGNALASVRGVIRTAYGLPPGTFVALAPSGAEAELFALAAAQSHPAGRPITSILVGPEEIAGGVALAAAGRHFAGETARGAHVRQGSVVDGFRDDTVVEGVTLRTRNGTVRPLDELAAACRRLASVAVAANRRVLLHRIDTSKTGLLAPEIPALLAIQESFPDQVDVVVDASQARLSPDRVGEYLALGWVVLLTGSNFLAGPPFSAAVLFPETFRDRFSGPLPPGLRDYTGRAEWPPGLVAVRDLQPGGGLSLALRWAAALAELRAFNAVPAAEQRQIISDLVAGIRSAITENADLHLVESAAPRRADSGADWDELAWNGKSWDGTGWDEIGTILSFALHDPAGPGLLPPPAVSRVCRWLHADIGDHLPEGTQAALVSLARRRFHLGLPITLPLAGADAGVLRIAVSAPFVSGEPSQSALDPRQRLARQIADVAALLQKVSLILRHWLLLDAHAPAPTHS